MAIKRYKKPRDKKLAREYEKLQELTNRSSKISFKILHETRSTKLPDKYEITYNLKSIVGINEDKSPIYGNLHKMQITIPPNWPAADSPPDFYMKTDIWHPNIKSTDPYKGHVCINSKAISVFEGLHQLITRIGELLQWKNYLAEDKPPYPEDLVVAEWVREYAEPKGIVNFNKGIVVDKTELLDQMKENTEPIFEDIEQNIRTGETSNTDLIIDIDIDDDNSDIPDIEIEM